MGATKATLIVVGTVVGTGAVLAYSPPHHTLNLGGGSLGGGSLGGGSKSTPSPTSTPSEVNTPTPTPTPAASTPAPVKTNTPAPTKATKKPVVPKKTLSAPKLVNGTFTGATSNTDYGPVQVQIDIKNSKIVAARALQLPTSTPRDQEINAQAIPILIQETIAASSSDIQGVSGASYTSQGWYDSLVSALNKAGL
jgi:uncharacterized protein with FMN-binding domain